MGFSADPAASSARTGQAAILLNAQVQAQAQADKEAQQRAEAIARVQVGLVLGSCFGEIDAHAVEVSSRLLFGVCSQEDTCLAIPQLLGTC